jgi:hypothetical protein
MLQGGGGCPPAGSSVRSCARVRVAGHGRRTPGHSLRQNRASRPAFASAIPYLALPRIPLGYWASGLPDGWPDRCAIGAGERRAEPTRRPRDPRARAARLDTDSRSCGRCRAPCGSTSLSRSTVTPTHAGACPGRPRALTPLQAPLHAAYPGSRLRRRERQRPRRGSAAVRAGRGRRRSCGLVLVLEPILSGVKPLLVRNVGAANVAKIAL